MEKEKKTRMTIAKVFALHANSIKSVMLKDAQTKTKQIKGTTKKNAEKKQKAKRKHYDYAKVSDIKQQVQRKHYANLQSRDKKI